MFENENWQQSTGQTVDNLVGMDLRYGGMHGGFAHLMHRLYQAAFEAEGEPLSLAAARGLQENVGHLDTVLIFTGAGMDPWLPKGETDGPPGAVGIAHGLALALGARPILVVEERSTEPVEEAALACGLPVLPFETLKHSRNGVSVVSYPEGKEESPQAAEQMLDRYDPSAIIAVERMGPNRDGEMLVHSGGYDGFDYVGGNVWMPPVMEKAKDQGIVTVGIGDRGNETGFGKIEDEVREIYQEQGKEGIACSVATDYLIASGASNWGAYGVEAMLAMLTETPEAMHSAEDERRMLERHSAAGSIDAVSQLSKPTVDGTSTEANLGIVSILNEIVSNRLTDFENVRSTVIDAE